MMTFIMAVGLVFAAEMGDKTQLVAMAFASKYKAWKVLAGVFAAVSILNLLAVVLGTYITLIIPIDAIRVVAAILFIAFGLLNLREGEEEDEKRNFKLGAIATVALTFFIGELGDKTQIMTITLAAKYNQPYAVLLGSTLGMLLADSLGVIVGTTVFKKIPQKAVKIISSAVFLFFGTFGLCTSKLSEYVSPVVTLILTLVISAVIIIIYKNNSKKTANFKSDSEA